MDIEKKMTTSSRYQVMSSENNDKIIETEQNENNDNGDDDIEKWKKNDDEKFDTYYMDLDLSPMGPEELTQLGYGKISMLGLKSMGMIDSKGGIGYEEKAPCSFHFHAIILAICMAVPFYGPTLLFFELVVGFPTLPLIIIGITLLLFEVNMFFIMIETSRSVLNAGYFRLKPVIEHVEKNKTAGSFMLVPYFIYFVFGAIFLGLPHLSSPILYRKIFAYLSVFCWPFTILGYWPFCVAGFDVMLPITVQYSKQFSDDCVKLLLKNNGKHDVVALQELQKRQKQMVKIMELFNKGYGKTSVLSTCILTLWVLFGLAGMCYPQSDGSLTLLQVIFGFLIALTCALFLHSNKNIRMPAIHFKRIEQRLSGVSDFNKVLRHFHGSHANFKAWLNGCKICISSYGIEVDEGVFVRLGTSVFAIFVAALGLVARTLLKV